MFKTALAIFFCLRLSGLSSIMKPAIHNFAWSLSHPAPQLWSVEFRTFCAACYSAQGNCRQYQAATCGLYTQRGCRGCMAGRSAAALQFFAGAALQLHRALGQAAAAGASDQLLLLQHTTDSVLHASNVPAACSMPMDAKIRWWAA